MKNSKVLLQFIKFGLVGTGGFIVDTAVFYLCALFLTWNPSRCISFFAAVVFTYVCNRSFSFGVKGSEGFIRQFFPYFASMLLGGAVNLGCFFILTLDKSGVFGTYPILAIAAGSIAGMFVNFVLSKLIFKK